MLLLCNYYVTYRCNAYCSFCHFADHKSFKTVPMADWQDYTRNVKEMRDLGVRFIDLTGGEPLLHPQIAEMAEYAQGLGMQTSITTNCLLYPKMAEKLAGRVSLLHFSLDSADPAKHDRIRGVGCFDHVMRSIEIARGLDEFPDILFTVTNETYSELPEMHRLASEKGLILIVNPVFSYFGNEGLNDKAIEYIESYTKGKSDIYLNRSYLTLRKNGGNKVSDPLCKAVSRVIVISPENEIILPCYHFANEKIKIDRPLSELRDLERIKYFKQNEGRFDFCEGCTVNCYFEPSFAFPTNRYGIESIPSKLRYSYNKLIKQEIQKTFFSQKNGKD